MFIKDINKDEKLAPYAKEILTRLDSVVGEFREGYFNSVSGPAYIIRRRIVYKFIANYILDNDELPKGVHFVHNKVRYIITFNSISNSIPLMFPLLFSLNSWANNY